MIRIYQTFRDDNRPRFSGSVRINDSWYQVFGSSTAQVATKLQQAIAANTPSSILLYQSDLEDLDLFLSQHPEIQL